MRSGMTKLIPKYSEFRGQGLGNQILRSGTDFGMAEFDADEMLAAIYSDNKASLATFCSQGYELLDDSKEPWNFVYKRAR